MFTSTRSTTWGLLLVVVTISYLLLEHANANSSSIIPTPGNKNKNNRTSPTPYNKLLHLVTKNVSEIVSNYKPSNPYSIPKNLWTMEPAFSYNGPTPEQVVKLKHQLDQLESLEAMKQTTNIIKIAENKLGDDYEKINKDLNELQKTKKTSSSKFSKNNEDFVNIGTSPLVEYSTSMNFKEEFETEHQDFTETSTIKLDSTIQNLIQDLQSNENAYTFATDFDTTEETIDLSTGLFNEPIEESITQILQTMQTDVSTENDFKITTDGIYTNEFSDGNIENSNNQVDEILAFYLSEQSGINIATNSDIPRPLNVTKLDSTALFFNDTKSNDVISSRIMEEHQEEIEEAAEHGIKSTVELYDINEPKWYKLGLTLENDSPAKFVSDFNGQHEEAKKLSRLGYMSLQMTTKLASRLSSRTRLSVAALRQQCPPREKPRCAPASKRYRTADGSCNNRADTSRGAALRSMIRFLVPHYADGIQQPRTRSKNGKLPSARAVSIEIHEDQDVELASVTHLLMQWGQFVDHDLTQTAQSRGFNGSAVRCCANGGRDFLPPELMHPDCFPIEVPPNDFFLSRLHGQRCIEFVRSAPAPPDTQDQCIGAWREQLNQVTAWLDGSHIYGSNAGQSDSLRSFRDGMLFYGAQNSDEQLNTLCRRGAISTSCFVPGDGRASEQPALTSLHAAITHFHNKIAIKLREMHSTWSDERIFQEARRFIGAAIQHVTYREFLPIVLGPEVIQLFGLQLLKTGYYDGYNDQVNPGPASSFVTAAFRFGHSLVQHSFIRADKEHRLIANNVSMHDEQSNEVNIWGEESVDRMLLGLCNQPSQKRDEFITEELTNHLFQTSRFSFGMDLAAINIQRGRDHGTPPYTYWREPCGLSEVETWEDLENIFSPTTLKKLRKLYHRVVDIDLFTGGLAEKPVRGGLVGPTFACIIAQQFSNLRKSDRFWYENGGSESSFTLPQLQQIRKITLAHILCQSLKGIDTIQPFVFLSADNFRNERISCRDPIINNIDLSFWADENIGNIDREHKIEPSLLKTNMKQKIIKNISVINEKLNNPVNTKINEDKNKTISNRHSNIIKSNQNIPFLDSNPSKKKFTKNEINRIDSNINNLEEIARITDPSDQLNLELPFFLEKESKNPDINRKSDSFTNNASQYIGNIAIIKTKQKQKHKPWHDELPNPIKTTANWPFFENTPSPVLHNRNPTDSNKQHPVTYLIGYVQPKPNEKSPTYYDNSRPQPIIIKPDDDYNRPNRPNRPYRPSTTSKPYVYYRPPNSTGFKPVYEDEYLTDENINTSTDRPRPIWTAKPHDSYLDDDLLHTTTTKRYFIKPQYDHPIITTRRYPFDPQDDYYELSDDVTHGYPFRPQYDTFVQQPTHRPIRPQFDNGNSYGHDTQTPHRPSNNFGQYLNRPTDTQYYTQNNNRPYQVTTQRPYSNNDPYQSNNRPLQRPPQRPPQYENVHYYPTITKRPVYDNGQNGYGQYTNNRPVFIKPQDNSYGQIQDNGQSPTYVVQDNNRPQPDRPQLTYKPERPIFTKPQDNSYGQIQDNGQSPTYLVQDNNRPQPDRPQLTYKPERPIFTKPQDNSYGQIQDNVQSPTYVEQDNNRPQPDRPQLTYKPERPIFTKPQDNSYGQIQDNVQSATYVVQDYNRPQPDRPQLTYKPERPTDEQTGYNAHVSDTFTNQYQANNQNSDNIEQVYNQISNPNAVSSLDLENNPNYLELLNKQHKENPGKLLYINNVLHKVANNNTEDKKETKENGEKVYIKINLKEKELKNNVTNVLPEKINNNT